MSASLLLSIGVPGVTVSCCSTDDGAAAYPTNGRELDEDSDYGSQKSTLTASPVAILLSTLERRLGSSAAFAKSVA